MQARTSNLLGAIVLGTATALAPAQDKSYDALAHPRTKAKAENQRVLLLLNGGNAAVNEALSDALADYRALGKLLRYEYQIAALPAASVAGKATRKRLGLDDLALPALAVLSADEETDKQRLGTLSAEHMVEGDAFAPELVRKFLKQHACEPLHARKVLADGLALAKKDKRHVFVYLSAPW